MALRARVRLAFQARSVTKLFQRAALNLASTAPRAVKKARVRFLAPVPAALPDQPVQTRSTSALVALA